MKKLIALAAIALVLVAAGCAKKAAVDEGASSSVTQQEVTSDQVQGADQSGVSDSAAMDQMQSVSATMANASLKRINFEFDQYTLSAEAKQVLAMNADFINNHSGFVVKIEGHCDERGSDEYNLALGEKRALAAQNYLLSLGVDASRLDIISYGEERPLVMGSNSDAYAQNRRAEFVAR